MTDVRRARIPLLWSAVKETALAKLVLVYHTMCPRVCRRTKLPGRGVHSEKVRAIGRR